MALLRPMHIYNIIIWYCNAHTHTHSPISSGIALARNNLISSLSLSLCWVSWKLLCQVKADLIPRFILHVGWRQATNADVALRRLERELLSRTHTGQGIIFAPTLRSCSTQCAWRTPLARRSRFATHRRKFDLSCRPRKVIGARHVGGRVLLLGLWGGGRLRRRLTIIRTHSRPQPATWAWAPHRCTLYAGFLMRHTRAHNKVFAPEYSSKCAQVWRRRRAIGYCQVM